MTAPLEQPELLAEANPLTNGEAGGLLAATHGSEVRFTYGNKTDWEIRLVCSGITFAWTQKKNRIWRMMALRPVWTPTQLLEFMRAEDPKAETYLQFAGVHPPNESSSPTAADGNGGAERKR